MKIMFAVHTYYPDQNGVQNVTQYLAEGLASRHEVLVIPEMKPAYLESEEFNGVKINRIMVSSKKFRFFGEKARFFEIINNFQPDILICVCVQSWPFDWISPVIEELNCKKVLFTHGYSAYMEKYPLLSDLIMLRLRAFKYHYYWKRYFNKAVKYMKKFDKITYLSETSTSYQYAEKYNLSNGMILGNAVDPLFFMGCVLENEDRFKPGYDVRFIYVANYDRNKNQKAILEAFYKVEEKNMKLTFIGSKKNDYYLELLALKNDYDQKYLEMEVDILTDQSRKQISDWLSAADIFICSSRYEEYPLMLCEAAAKGLPIISSDVGHVKEMPECIIINTIDSRDLIDEMAFEMKKLAMDGTARRENGCKLREWAVKNCQLEEKIKEFEALLESL